MLGGAATVPPEEISLIFDTSGRKNQLNAVFNLAGPYWKLSGPPGPCIVISPLRNTSLGPPDNTMSLQYHTAHAELALAEILAVEAREDIIAATDSEARKAAALRFRDAHVACQYWDSELDSAWLDIGLAPAPVVAALPFSAVLNFRNPPAYIDCSSFL